MTNHSLVPNSLYEITSERIASSLARPPALRITCAAPSTRPAYLAGSSRASMQVRIAKRRAGGKASLLLSPKFERRRGWTQALPKESDSFEISPVDQSLLTAYCDAPLTTPRAFRVT